MKHLYLPTGVCNVSSWKIPLSPLVCVHGQLERILIFLLQCETVPLEYSLTAGLLLQGSTSSLSLSHSQSFLSYSFIVWMLLQNFLL